MTRVENPAPVPNSIEATIFNLRPFICDRGKSMRSPRGVLQTTCGEALTVGECEGRACKEVHSSKDLGCVFSLRCLGERGAPRVKDFSQGSLHGEGERALHKGAATRTCYEIGGEFTERSVEVPPPMRPKWFMERGMKRLVALA